MSSDIDFVEPKYTGQTATRNPERQMARTNGSGLPNPESRKIEHSAIQDLENEAAPGDTEEKFTTQNGMQVEYITGWRLHLITFGICTSLFMAQLDSTIVSTTIIAITNDLGGYIKSSWVFTSYLLTYSGLLIVWAKLSDFYGRKQLLIASVLIFVIFSGACGASQSITQLIMFRWLQGIGGCGIYSLGTLYFFELVPPHKFADYTALVTVAVTLSLVLGPLIGGSVADHGPSSWRWIFLMNIPIGAVALLLLVFTLPSKLAKEPAARQAANGKNENMALRSLRKVDILGALLLLGACLLLATALQQAAQGTSFAAASVFVLIIFSGLMWIGFGSWQWFITTKRTVPEPVFPWRLCQSLTAMGMIINSYLLGTVLTVGLVQIPQRLITVNGLSSLASGVRSLPYGAVMPVGGIISSILIGRAKVAPIMILLIGGVLQVIGAVFLSMASNSFHVPSSLYGFQAILGVGIGFYNATLILCVPFVMDKRDLATGTAAIAQFRVLGAVLGIAIVTTVQSRSLKTHLVEILPVVQVDTLLQTTDILPTFPAETQALVRSAFGHAYNLEMKILIGFAAAQLLVTALMCTRKPIRVVT